MSRFPHLPETFILREMDELERQGWQVSLYPLIRQNQRVVHAEARPWVERMHSLSFISLSSAAANARRLASQPGRYLSLWKDVVTGNLGSPKFLGRAVALLPMAVYAARLMVQEGIEHIHAHYATHPALFAWLIHRLEGIPFSVTVHAHDIFVDTTMLATKLRDAGFVAAISEYNRQRLGRELGPWALDKTHVVHCGIEPWRYQPREHARRQGEVFEIVNVGSLQPYKGQSCLVEACALLAKRGLAFRCRIVGEGEERDRLKDQIAAAGLESCVFLLGSLPQEDLARLLPQAHVYVQPSIITPDGKMEGIPVAIMEAFASGLPVVASELSGVPELVRPGETGLLTPPGDAHALAEALYTLSQDPAQATCLARNGRQLVLSEFDLSANVTRLGDLITNRKM